MAVVTVSPNPVVGQPLTAGGVRGYGTSLIIAQNHITIVSDRWLAKLGSSLGGARVVEQNYGVGGSKLLAPGGVSLSSWAMTWSHAGDRLTNTFTTPGVERPPTPPIVAFQFGINDGGGLWNEPNLQSTFLAALEAITRIARAGYSWRDTSGAFTYITAGWNAVATNVSRGGTAHARVGAGNLSWTSPASFPGGTMTFYPLVRAGDNETWRCRAKINGGAYVTTVDATAGIGLSLTANQNPVPVTVPNVPAGAGQVVELDFDNMGAGGVYFVGATLESSWPPLVLLVNQPTLPTMPPGSWPNLTQAILNGLNASHAAVAALFADGKVLNVDLTSMNAVASFWQDDLHFSPSGHATIANLALGALRTAGGVPLGYSAGPVISLVDLGLSGLTPDWSGVPGSMIYDPSNKKLWAFNTIAPADASSATLV